MTEYYHQQISSISAVVAARFSGSISTVSSALIIFIIFQSRSKLSTIYHRIMFGMSCADILSSIAMALSTLLMPREINQDLLDRGYHLYPYAGTKLGNMQTCSAQGFFFTFGAYTMFSYNLSLCLYNTCAISLRMQESDIVKYVEPVLHLFPFAVGLGMALLPLAFGGQYIPNGFYQMWCSVTSTSVPQFYRILSPTLTVVFFALIVLCSVMMVGRVYRIEQRLSNAQRSANYDKAADSLKNTKVIIFQMALYILSYVLTLAPLQLSRIDRFSNVIFYLIQILQPLQGFFNALIFINHKIYNYRRSHDGASRCYVLKLLLAGDSEEVMLFSRISMINYDQRRRIMELELEDESGFVEKISIEDDIPPSVADVFYDEEGDGQDLSGFSQLPSPAVQSRARFSMGASKGGLSWFSSKSPSNENEESLNEQSRTSSMNDSRLSFSRGSVSRLSQMSRANNADMSKGGLSGISSVGEEENV